MLSIWIIVWLLCGTPEVNLGNFWGISLFLVALFD